MATYDRIRRFLLPPISPKILLRIVLVALCAYVFFGHICIPFRIKGRSMEPTYHNGGFNFCWRPAYFFTAPARHDLVLVRLAGSKVMLLKRVVALEGQRVEFRNGKLFVNGLEVDEPYVRYPCNWNLPPRQVREGYLYVVGDNRTMPMTNQSFGQALSERIIGAPLW